MKWHRDATEVLAREDGGPPGEGRPRTGDWAASSTEPAPAALSSSELRTPLGDLHTALAAFRAHHADGVYSAKRMIGPLLDVWALAAAVDRIAAHPIEAELVRLVEREVVTSWELSDCITLVEAALAPLTS